MLRSWSFLKPKGKNGSFTEKRWDICYLSNSTLPWWGMPEMLCCRLKSIFAAPTLSELLWHITICQFKCYPKRFGFFSLRKLRENQSCAGWKYCVCVFWILDYLTHCAAVYSPVEFLGIGRTGRGFPLDWHVTAICHHHITVRRWK